MLLILTPAISEDMKKRERKQKGGGKKVAASDPTVFNFNQLYAGIPPPPHNNMLFGIQ